MPIRAHEQGRAAASRAKGNQPFKYLAGIDTPSVDLFDDRELTAHRALGRLGIACLEGLRLDGAVPGLYTLIALPLRIAGADGSPVRA